MDKQKAAILISIWKCKCCDRKFTVNESYVRDEMSIEIENVKARESRMTHNCDEGAMNPRTGFCELVGYQVKL